MFVHGVNNGATSWAPLAARLAGFRCILLDRPGCGLSEPIPRRVDTLERFATYAETLIVDVLDALELPTAHVVGTSLGGYHTLRTAAAHPERLGADRRVGLDVGRAGGPHAVGHAARQRATHCAGDGRDAGERSGDALRCSRGSG